MFPILPASRKVGLFRDCIIDGFTLIYTRKPKIPHRLHLDQSWLTKFEWPKSDLKNFIPLDTVNSQGTPLYFDPSNFVNTHCESTVKDAFAAPSLHALIWLAKTLENPHLSNSHFYLQPELDLFFGKNQNFRQFYRNVWKLLSSSLTEKISVVSYDVRYVLMNTFEWPNCEKELTFRHYLRPRGKSKSCCCPWKNGFL